MEYIFYEEVDFDDNYMTRNIFRNESKNCDRCKWYPVSSKVKRRRSETPTVSYFYLIKFDVDDWKFIMGTLPKLLELIVVKRENFVIATE